MSEALRADQRASDELYAKIALDNKLVTQLQLDKAAERRQRTSISIGEALLALGFVSDRQNQSILNACHYRVQRDQDKRFARQVLRMGLLDQPRLEAALDEQKDTYARTGKVTLLADVLVEGGGLSEAQVDGVAAGLRDREQLRRSGHGHALRGSNTPVALPPRGPSAEADLDDEDLDDEDLGDLDDEDLGDLDDEDLGDLDDEDLGALDDEDLGALDDEDLGALDDEDLDDEDLDDLDDVGLDDEDLDDDDLDGVLEGIDREFDRLGEAARDAAAALDEAGEIDLGSALERPPVAEPEDDDDERELALHASELDSEVELDPSDIEALDELTGGDRPDSGSGWAADAFDDRPISSRVSTQAPPSGERTSQPAAIPGGDVFDDDLSGEAPVAPGDEPSAERLARISEVGGVSDSVVSWEGPADEVSSEGPASPSFLEDPRLRAAFERAMEAAWEVFAAELRRDEARGR